MMPTPKDTYQNITKHLNCGGKLKDDAVTTEIGSGYQCAISALIPLKRVDLNSRVTEKRYFAFSNGSRISRPINCDLWDPDHAKWLKFRECLRTRKFGQLDAKVLDGILYSCAISFCAWCDLYADSRKVPGTFFERFVANLMGTILAVEPRKSLQVLNFDSQDTNLPTDLIFDLGKGAPKYHVPVKTSTRERAIQIWAHQRVIDGVFGVNRVLGTPVLLAETKVNSRNYEVVEICTPMQWQLFQSHISQLQRIYYLDLPANYQNLVDATVKVQVTPFSNFFYEYKDLR